MLARRKAAGIIDSDDSPLDALMDDLRWWKRQRDNLGKQLMRGLGPEDSIFNLKPDPEKPDQARMFERYFEARGEVRAAALAVVAYVHPRLSPMAPEAGGGLKDLSKLTDEELDALERIARKIAGSYGGSEDGGEGGQNGEGQPA